MIRPWLSGEVERPPDPDFATADIPESLKVIEVQQAVYAASQQFHALKQVLASAPDHHEARQTLERIRDQARALAETMPGYGAAELLWRGPQIATEGTDVVKDSDGNTLVRLVPREDLPELSARLHLLANDAEHWLVWLKKKRGGNRLVAERALICRLAEIYQAHEGDTGKPSRDAAFEVALTP